MSQSFDIQSIFTRAAELGIELALDGENSIAVSAAPGVVTAQILDVLRAHKQDLIEYLQSLATTPENAPPDKDLTAQAGDIDVTPRAEACAICGGPLHRVCSVGVGYCANHWPYAGDEPIREGSQCCKCGAPARHASPSGYQYCTEHYQCVRGHALRWRRHEESASWRCACFWEHTNEPGMTRAEYQRLVRKIIELFPGKHAQPASYEQLLTEEIERLCSLAREAGRERLSWHVPGSGFADEPVSFEEYAGHMRECVLHGDGYLVYAALDDMAYLGVFYANQTAEARLTGDAFQQAVDRAIADMRAKLSRSARQIA